MPYQLNINPIIFKVKNICITWYGISYITGFLLGKFYAKKISNKYIPYLDKTIIENFSSTFLILLLLGGRIGYFLFYDLKTIIKDPIEIIKINHGGMSFHGSLVAILIGSFYYSKIKKTDLKTLLDILSSVIPIGIFLGRGANFINQELCGRIINSHSSWGIIFPLKDSKLRHPSQIYEAILEGLVIFLILTIARKYFNILRKKGQTTMLFLSLYCCFRFFIEFFREPDEQIGLFFNSITLGQILSVFTLLTYLLINKYL